MSNLKTFYRAVVLAFALCVVAVSAWAEGDDSGTFKIASINTAADSVSAHEVVGQVTDEVLEIIRKVQNEGADVDQAAAAMDELLSQVVDFRFIVAGVMGKQALQSASREQLQAFASKFKNGLISTYSNGLKSFTDYEVKVVPPETDVTGLKQLPVAQTIEGPKGTFHATYTMAIDRQNQWVLRNVILNGINLGSQLRGQFQVSLKKNNNDLDKVIAEWDA